MISIENISLQFTGQKIFDSISFMIKPGDKIGLVGRNGAGKTTLLKLITKQALPDEGQVICPDGISLGYLPQHLNFDDTKTVFDEALMAFDELNKLEKEIEKLNNEIASRTDYESEEYLELIERSAEKSERFHLLQGGSPEAEAEKVLMGLGFLRTDFQRPTKEFSGGWRMRIELAKILLRSPDVFLLDEPTNHLDIESIQWLENFLKSYKGSVVLISHDRRFLDNITNRTVEISMAKIFDYKTYYSKYLVQRKERREQLQASYDNQQKQIQETRDFIERFRYKPTKSNQVQSRIKQLEKMNIIELDEEDTAAMHIKFPPAPRSGITAYKSEGLVKRYGDKLVLDDLNITIERGEKVAFVGKNGEGKTTLSRIIIGELDCEGESKLGHNIEIGYFAQNQDRLLDGEITVFDTLDKVAVGDIRTKLRDILGAFLFSGESVDKKVKVLSGGEKSRLSMAKLLLQPYNLLVLDEPTNHLDMRSKDILKNALSAFDGTLILVSHDRDFLDGLVDKVYEFKNKNIKEHLGGIYDFLKKKEMDTLHELNLNNQKDNKPKKKEATGQKLSYEDKKQFERIVRKAKNEVQKIEQKIEKFESEIAEMETLIASGDVPDNDFFQQYEKAKKQLDEQMAYWELKTEELHKLESNKMS